MGGGGNTGWSRDRDGPSGQGGSGHDIGPCASRYWPRHRHDHGFIFIDGLDLGVTRCLVRAQIVSFD